MNRITITALASVLFVGLLTTNSFAGKYKNFTVSIYTRYQETEDMIRNPATLASNWDYISSQLKVDKIYLEITRNHDVVDEAGLETLKKFFTDKGVQVAAGLGLTVNEGNNYQAYCYTDPADRAFVKSCVELAARHFDEVILDDFFFTNTKYDSDIAAKGNRSWTDFRLDLMREVSKNLIVGPAKAVNPKIKVVIKYPNWYESFQGSGYDLDQEPKIFDGIYTGTETRSPIGGQHLQQYQSYQLMRFLDNVKPGGNGGGWVDTSGSGTVDRYAEQLWNTVFARCPEMTLFDFRQVLGNIPANGGNRAWATEPTSFNFAAMTQAAGPNAGNSSWARVAGYSLEQVDSFLGNMGKPTGVKSYKPFQSVGEEYLHNYFGMIGVPIDLYPYFPTDADMVLLTEDCKFDPDIVAKIKAQLTAGKSVAITSGLFIALYDKGIQDIVEMQVTGKTIPLRQFPGSGRGGGAGGRGGAAPANPLDHDIDFPEIRGLENDENQVASATASGTTYTLITRANYSKGTFYLICVPDNPADLYNLPDSIIASIRSTLCTDQPIRIDSAPPQVAIFTYDNNTFIVENYSATAADVTVSASGGFTKLHDMVNDKDIAIQPARGGRGGRRGGGGGGSTPRASFSLNVLPHSYLALAAEK